MILVGDCLKRFKGKGVGHWAGNCPPLEPHVLWTIIERRDFYEMEPDTRERMAREQDPWLRHIDKLKANKESKE